MKTSSWKVQRARRSGAAQKKHRDRPRDQHEHGDHHHAAHEIAVHQREIDLRAEQDEDEAAHHEGGGGDRTRPGGALRPRAS